MGWLPDVKAELEALRKQQTRRQVADSNARAFTPEQANIVARVFRQHPWLSKDPGVAIAAGKAGVDPDSDEFTAASAEIIRGRARTLLGYGGAGSRQRPSQVTQSQVIKAREQLTQSQVDANLAAGQGVFGGGVNSVTDNPVTRPLRDNPVTDNVLEPAMRHTVTGENPLARGVRATSRVATAAMQAPQQAIQGQFRTSLQNIQEHGVVEGALRSNPLDPRQAARLGSQTDIGLIAGTLAKTGELDTGSGFFTSGQVVADRRQNEVHFGGTNANGQVVTIGRAGADVFFEPGSKEFNVLSGAIDGGVAIGADTLTSGSGAAARRAAKNFRAPAAVTTATTPVGRAAENVVGLIRGAPRNTYSPQLVDAYLTSRQGRNMVQRIADEASITKIDAMFDNRLDPSILRQFADETDPNAIGSTLRNYLGIGISEAPKNRVGMLGFAAKEALPSPARRLLSKMPSRTFVDLDDSRASVTQLERSLVNANTPRETIDQLVGEMALSTTRAGRFGVWKAALDDVATRAAVENGVPVHQAKRMTTLFADGRNNTRSYFVDAIGEDRNVLGVMVNGQLSPTPSPHLMSEMIGRHMPMPDARSIRRAFSDPATKWLTTNADTNGLRLPWATLTALQDRIWKPGALLRGAWPVRVLGEEQARIAAAGFKSMPNHPMGYIAFMLGDRNRTGRMLEKFGQPEAAQRVSKAQADVFGGILAESDEFGAAMYRTSGGLLDDEVRLGNYIKFDKGEANYFDAVADELATLAADPVAQMVSRVAGGVDPRAAAVNPDDFADAARFADDVPPAGPQGGGALGTPTYRTGAEAKKAWSESFGPVARDWIDGLPDDVGEAAYGYRNGLYHYMPGDDAAGTLEDFGDALSRMSSAQRRALDEQLAAAGVPDEVVVYRGTGAANTPRGDYVNVTTDPYVAGNFARTTDGGVMREYKVRRSDILGFGHPEQGELILRSSALDDGVEVVHRSIRQGDDIEVVPAAGGGGRGGVIETREVGGAAAVPPPAATTASVPKNPLLEVQDFFWNNMRHTREEMHRNNPTRLLNILDNRADADYYITTVLDRINIKTGRDARLLDAVSTGRIDGESLFQPGTPFVSKEAAKKLEAYVDVLPDRVRGPQMVRARTGGREGFEGLSAATDTMMTHLMSKPANYLSRSPVFKQSYVDELIAMSPRLDPADKAAMLRGAETMGLSKTDLKTLGGVAGKQAGDAPMPLAALDELAKGKALDQVRDLLYDLSDRSQFFDVFRLIFPFGEAWGEMVTRWTKLIGENPKSVLTVKRLIEGGRNPDVGELAGAPEGQGFFYENEFGDEVFGYPLSGQLMGLLGLPETPLTGRLAGLSLMTEVLPGVGPVAQWPLAALIPDTPEWDRINEMLFPFGRPTNLTDPGSALNEMLPAWLKTLTRGTSEGGATAEGQRQFANTQMDVMRWLVASGDFDIAGSPDSAAELTRLVETSRDQASWMTIVRGMAQNVSPSSPIFEWYLEAPDGKKLPMASLVADYREMQDEDFANATVNFLEKYGDGAFLLMQNKSITISPGIAAPTEEANDWLRSNSWAMDDYGLTYGFFAPQGGEFSSEAYQRQLELKDRVPLTPEQFLKAGNDLLGKSIYYAARDKAMAQATAAGRKSLTDEQQATMRQLDEFLRTNYEGYGDEGGKVNKASSEEIIDELSRAVADPRLADTPTAKSIAEYMKLRAAVRERSAVNLGTENSYQSASGGANYRAALSGFAAEIIEEDPSFLPVWERVFRSEIDEGLRKDDTDG